MERKNKLIQFNNSDKKFLLIFFSLFIFFTTLFLLPYCLFLFLGPNFDEQVLENTTKTYTFKNAAVATDNMICSEVGKNIMEKHGGNAIDASIGSTLCLGVLQQFASGLGGGGTSMVYIKEENKVYHYDFREWAPRAATTNMYSKDPINAGYGGLSIAIPGEILGLWQMWKDHGSVNWEILFEEPIQLAEESIVGPLLADRLQEYKLGIFSSKSLRSIFAPNNILLKEGDILKQPALANTLRKLSIDPKSLYDGDLAKDFIDDLKDTESIITAQDLLDYMDGVRSTENDEVLTGVNVKEPLRFWYQGYEFFVGKPPYSGGVVMGLVMNLLENLNLGKLGFDNQLTDHWIIEAFKFGFSDRNAIGDPDFVEKIDYYIEQMLSKNHAGVLRRKFNNQTTYPPEHYVDLLDENVESLYDSGTTHLSVVDEHKNMVALTSTINGGFGSFILSEKLGLVYNNEMADFSSPNQTDIWGLPPSQSNFIKPFKKPTSSMSPTFIFKDDLPFMTIGGSGGSKIITAVIESVLNVIDFDMNIGDAIATPRFHCQNTGDVQVENEFPESKIQELKNTHHIVVQKGINSTLANVQGIVLSYDRENSETFLNAASDWRKKGVPAGY
eukprot:TRINITY_DN12048_c0_g1_i1.p1 TRINITY_DN12048_c0_g1~~TRINITY_DN12048_c0_g1_i1.p1  ORF type:complete len:613 (+),score=201.80 TRINITY_DN12048_c0_g1_i1:82-1920(+)